MKIRVLKKALHLLSALCLLAFIGSGHAAAETQKLRGYGVDLKQTSASGLSSGAFMTAQFHVAYSATLMGAGIIAGGPYYCAGSYSSNTFVENATTTCMNPIGLGPDSETLIAKAREFAAKGWIDDLDNLKDDRIYIFSGANDKVVTAKVVDQTEKFYRLAGVPPENIKYVKTINAGHAIITDNDDDVPCSKTEPPFINDCDFYQSREILEHIYGELNPPAASLGGKIIKFDQSEFVHTPRASMSGAGFVYVPASCEQEQETCRVHIAIHGCLQGAGVIKDAYYATTGYNEIADTNRIIVLYPQVDPSAASPTNPEGCWDFWGYSSPDPDEVNFYKKDAPQMTAIWRMLQRLAEPGERSDN
jgi:poly(3-hydroxybutyrate) depolymerase